MNRNIQLLLVLIDEQYCMLRAFIHHVRVEAKKQFLEKSKILNFTRPWFY